MFDYNKDRLNFLVKEKGWVCMTTLNEFLNMCSEAIEIYNENAEYSGMEGDIDGFNYYEALSEKLKTQIDAIKRDLKTNQYLSTMNIVNWLKEKENETVAKVLIEALETVRDNKKYKLTKLSQEVDYCNKFLNNIGLGEI